MKFRTIFFLCLLIVDLMQSAFCQSFSVTGPATGQTADGLIQQKLAGPGVVLSNGTFNGSAAAITSQQIGIFNRGSVNFPINSGIVMTTGNRSSIPQNAGQQINGDMTGPCTNTYLSTILPGAQFYDKAVLDFDFVAFSDTFSFNYVFASEEYPEYVCSEFNDVFGFFVTGLNPVTGQNATWNVALIPHSVTPVSINTVNSGQCGLLYSPTSNTNLTNTQYYRANATAPIFDGYTVKLAASSVIAACQPYHMHLAVADVGDQDYDSGVFLEEGSFYSPTLSIRNDYNLPDVGGDTLVQNCRDVDVTFALPKALLSGVYNSTFSFGGDAIPQHDFIVRTNFGTMSEVHDGDAVRFPTGDSLVRVHVGIPDTADLGDTVKMLELYITTVFCEEYYYGWGVPQDSSAGRVDTLRFYLKGNEPIVLGDTTFEACRKCEHLSVELKSGFEPLLYQWSPATGLTTPDERETAANITENKIFQVIAHDPYGCLADTATVKVKINQLPTAEAVITPEYGCVPLTVHLSAPDVPSTCDFHWTVTSDTIVLEGDNKNYNPVLTVPGPYDVSLWVSSAPGCNDSIQYDAEIYASDAPRALCYYVPEEPQNGKEVFFYNQSVEDNITNFHWDFGDGASSNEENPIHIYRLMESKYLTANFTVTNEYGCSDDTSFVVPVLDNFAFYVPSGFTPDANGKNDIFLPKVRDVDYYQLDVFTRNGQLIFHTLDSNEGWDGTYNGKMVPTGVYIWRIQYSRPFNPTEIIPQEGTVTLLR